GSTVAGDFTITGTFSGKTANATLHVTPAALDHIVVSPHSSTIAAGATQSYTAEGFDVYGNSSGDVTGSTTFSASGAATCSGADCGSTVPGDYTVTGDKGGLTDSADLHVTPAGLDHIVVSPHSSTIAAGETQSYTAEGFDVYGNSRGDVTGSTDFSASGAATCSGADCGSTVAGDYTVTGDKGGISDSADLHVTPAGLDHIVVSPHDATIAAGETQSYTAEGFDVYGNSRGDVTGSTTFSASGAATCSGADCGSTASGDYTVTGSYGGISDTSDLHVTPAGLDHIVVSPHSSTIA